MKKPLKKQSESRFVKKKNGTIVLTEEQVEMIEELAWIKVIRCRPPAAANKVTSTRPVGAKRVNVVSHGVQISIPIRAVKSSVKKQLPLIAAEIEKLNAEIMRSESKLADQQFVSRAKSEVVEAERERLRDAQEKRASLVQRRDLIST